MNEILKNIVKEQGIVNIILKYKYMFELIEKKKKLLQELLEKVKKDNNNFIYIDYAYRYESFRTFEISRFIGNNNNIDNINNEIFDRFIYELDLSLVHEPNILWFVNDNSSIYIYEYHNFIEILHPL